MSISGEAEIGGRGQVVVDGKSYDLAKGALFLVSGIAGDLQVKQLNREMSKLSLDPHELAAFGKADAEIADFFKPAKAE